MRRLYNKGDKFVGPNGLNVEVVATQRFGHTTGLTIELTWSGNATVRRLETNAHRFTRSIKGWKLRRKS